TPYRVINRNVCNSCANDVNIDLRMDDVFFCPRHKGTDRMFECSIGISFTQVKAVIETIPGFGEFDQ
ncbi:MAG: autotransporter strand-loop-strand O-heptosyltransferase, partial [Bombella apis]|nr:autotransporter strand-loop-strand O-heptosyltransferase [Bombella apis]